MDKLLFGISPDQFNWRPAPGRWSISECLTHLNVVDGLDADLLARAVTDARAKGWTSAGPFRYNALSTWLIGLLEPPVKRKGKAPKIYVPPPDRPLETVQCDFYRIHDRLVEILGMAEGLDLARASKSRRRSRAGSASVSLSASACSPRMTAATSGKPGRCRARPDSRVEKPEPVRVARRSQEPGGLGLDEWRRLSTLSTDGLLKPEKKLPLHEAQRVLIVEAIEDEDVCPRGTNSMIALNTKLPFYTCDKVPSKS